MNERVEYTKLAVQEINQNSKCLTEVSQVNKYQLACL